MQLQRLTVAIPARNHEMRRLSALGIILTVALVALPDLHSGHMPPPRPSPPSTPTDSLKGTRKLDVNADGPSEGVFGTRSLYPILDGLRLMPLERLPDVSKLKYEDGSAKWSWEWEEAKEGAFLLPAESLERSTEVIKLSQEVFKRFRDEDVESLVKAGPVILPLVIGELEAPGYPAGWSKLDAQERKGLESSANTRKKVRSQAMGILGRIPGSLVEPYMYGALVDLDAGIRAEALKFFSESGREPSLGALLLLWSHDTSPELEGLVKPMMEKEVPGSFVKAEALRKASAKDLLKLLKDASLPPRCLVVGLERLEIPSFRGDDSKAERKKAETELKAIEEALEPHVGKWVGKGKYEAPEGKVREAGEHEILLWHRMLQLGHGEVYARLEEAHRDGRWWCRYLVTRALSDAWEQRKEATPRLLERQRDWFYVVRREANKSLMALHRLSVPFEEPPALPSDSFVIDQWEKWWLGRKGIKGLDDADGWTSIVLKADEGNVYSPLGPTKHAFLAGKMGSVQVALIDHNNNGRYDDFGIDNFVVGGVDKPGTFLSQLARIEGKYYFLKFESKTFTLKVKAYEGPLGRVKVKESYAKEMALEFLVIGKSADVTIQVERDAKTKVIELEVPAGRYNIYAGNVQRGGKRGKDVYIAHIGTGGNRFFEVPEKGEVEIKLGEPLHFDADVDFTTGKGDKPVIRIKSPRVIGVFDELYFGIVPDFIALEVRLVETSGKLIKAFDWRVKAEGTKDGEDVIAEQDAKVQRRKELDKELATIDAQIRQLEVDVKIMDDRAKQGGFDPRIVNPNVPWTAKYNEVVQNLAKWRKHREDAVAQYMGSDDFVGQASISFHPIVFPLDKLPMEYDVEVSGQVFFGRVEPLKIRVKGRERASTAVTADAPKN